MLVGLGRIGLLYDLDLPSHYCYTHARAFSGHPRFQLVAGVDPDADRRGLFESRYQRKSYASTAEALAEHAPDVAVIAVATDDHSAATVAALEGLSVVAVLCEKPLAYRPDDARRIAAACADRGARLFVNYVRRSDPSVIDIRRRLDSGEIRGPFKGICWYAKGFLHNGSHFVNLLAFWLGPAEKAQLIEKHDRAAGWDADVDARIIFRSGVVQFMSVPDTLAHYGVELIAASGRIRYDGDRIYWTPASGPAAADQVLSQVTEALPDSMPQYQWHVADQLAAALDGAPANICDAREALETLDSMHAVIQQVIS